MKEVWVKINGFNNYEISNLGQVRSLDRKVLTKTNKIKVVKGRVLKNQLSWNKKYYCVQIYDNNRKVQCVLIHRLVAQHFIPNPNNYPIVNHIDENRFNNRVDNLEWVTIAENNLYSYKKHPERKNVTEILQYSLEGNFIKKWNSISEAAKFFNVRVGSISDCLRGKSKSSCKYIWKYYNGQTIPQKIEGYKINSKYRKVIQYDLFGKFIKVWNSMLDIEKELNIDKRGINNCCKQIIGCSGNYVWRFYEINYPNKIQTNFKKILQYDLEDNLINTFNSPYEAAFSIGKPNNQGKITSCCKGTKKTAYGFKWKYEE